MIPIFGVLLLMFITSAYISHRYDWVLWYNSARKEKKRIKQEGKMKISSFFRWFIISIVISYAIIVLVNSRLKDIRLLIAGNSDIISYNLKYCGDKFNIIDSDIETLSKNDETLAKSIDDNVKMLINNDEVLFNRVPNHIHARGKVLIKKEI